MPDVEKTATLSIPNEAARLAETRLFVRSFLMDVEASEEDVFEILVAVEEAATNALRHGGQPTGDGLIGIRCVYTPAEFIVQVIDDGVGFKYRPLEHREMPDPLAPGGRGLFLMNRLMDRVDISSSGRGTTVTMTKPLHGQDDTPAEMARDRTYGFDTGNIELHRLDDQGRR